VPALFMFFWQIAHFQALLLKYQGEYRSAGFKLLFTEPRQGGSFLFINLVLTVMMTFVFPFVALIRNGFLILLLAVADAAIFASFLIHVSLPEKAIHFNRIFLSLYLYQMAILGILMIASFI
jgi:heme O synthase-like polyprenyltransferase